jgi:hypothetical protein
MKALIINYQRVTLPSRLADWLAAAGCTPVFIDNNSTYPPLLEYYFKTKHEVILLAKNYGHRVVWDEYTEVMREAGIRPDERYIVTDPDLDMSGIPDDWLHVLSVGLDKYKGFDKCGFSLEIDDVPECNAAHVRACEGGYWRKPLDTMFFNAPIDTTFALYREGVRKYSHSAIRTSRPYTARHVPWYYERLRDLPADEQYYFEKATASSSGKARLKW